MSRVEGPDVIGRSPRYGSILLPWLLVAPLLAMVLALPLWQWIGWPWLGWLAGIAGALALMVMLAAFVANWRRRPP